MAEQRSSTELAALVKQLLELSALTNHQLAGMLDELGFTASEGGTLWALADAEAPMPMREVARRLGCDPSNVTLICDKLEAAGMVERQRHPSDGRARVLTLTDDGREQWSRVQERLAHDSPIASLTPADRRQLRRLLTLMNSVG